LEGRPFVRASAVHAGGVSGPRGIAVHADRKSPRAYLAKDLACELERDFPVWLQWLPHVADIPGFPGSAR